MNTFILLHDAFQGGWAWQSIARSLRSLGCLVYTPTFSGCGERSHIPVTDSPIHTYLADIENLVSYEAVTDAVLVCSGFAGMLGPVLATRLQPAVRRLVFLDAAVPQPGKSYLDIAPEPIASLLRNNSRDGVAEPFMAGLPRTLEQEHGSRRKLCDFPLQAFTESYTGPEPDAWPESVFLHCGGDWDPFARTMLGRAERLGLDVVEIDMRGVPVMARSQDIARELKALAPKIPDRQRGACGNVPMPEEMRLLYCPRHRKRAAMNTAAQGLGGAHC